jgi:hypothetical protein
MDPREIPYVGDSRVLAAIYGSLLVPLVGPALLIVCSSIAYYLTRPTRPGFARWINRHAWIAIGLNVLGNLVFLVWARF